MKTFNRIVYLFYIFTIIYHLIWAIVMKDFDKVIIAIWVVSSFLLFSVFNQAERENDWKENLIKKLLSDNLANLEDDKHYCIHYENKKPKILFVPRKQYTEKFERVEEAKKIASNIIGCEYVDGRNLYIDGKYVAGVYIDDLEIMTQRHEMVIINEIDGLDNATCEKIIEYLKEDNDFTKVLKEYELI